MKSALLETKKNIHCVAAEVADLPNTITISTKQVFNRVEENEEECDSSPVEESLQRILNNQEQTSLLQEERVNRLDGKLALHSEGMKVMQKGLEGNIEDIKQDITSVIEWKDEQSSIDLVGLQRSQDSVLSSFRDMKNELEYKMSRQDVDAKLDAKVSEIVDHMQNALLSVEEDEADFKAVTDALKTMCDTLKDNKADKSEIALLRTQFIQNEVDGSSAAPVGAGSTLDNEGIRQILTHYSTVVSVERQLDKKIDKDSVFPRLDRTDAVIHGIQSTLEQLLHIIRAGHGTEEMVCAEQRPQTAPSAYELSDPITRRRKRSDVKIDCGNRKRSHPENVLDAWPETFTNGDKTLMHHIQTESLCDNRVETQSSQDIFSHHNKTTSIEHLGVTKHAFTTATDAKSVSFNGNSDNHPGPIKAIQQGIALPTTNGRQPVYSSSILELTGSCCSGAECKDKKDVKCLPLINRDRTRLNPGNSYGGGFQIVDPPLLSASQPCKQHHNEKQGRDRTMDQYKSILPVIETKLMIAGLDGNFYVGRRQQGVAGVRVGGVGAVQKVNKQMDIPSNNENRTKIV